MPSILVATGFVRIDSDTKPAMKALQSLGAIGASALSTTLLPATAAVSAGILSMANAAASAGAAVGAFAAAVKPQFQAITDASTQYQKVQDAQTQADLAEARARAIAREQGVKYGEQIKITSKMSADARARAQEYNQALSQSKTAADAVTKAQDTYNQQLKTMPKATADTARAFVGLQNDFKSWSDSLAGSTMPIFTDLINKLRDALPKLTPLVRTAATEVRSFVSSLGEGQAGKVFREFGDGLQRNAGSSLRSFLDTARNLAVGVVGIMNAFMPASSRMAGGLSELTKRFADFGAGLSKSQGFQQFMDRANETGPVLMQTLTELARAFAEIASAAGPLSGVGITVLRIFAELVDAIPTPVLRLLVPAILAVNTGMKLYAIYQSAAAAATWFFNTSVTASNGAIATSRAALLLFRIQQIASAVATGVATAAQWAWNAAMAANPMGLVIIGIAALVAGIVWVATKTQFFQKLWHTVWGTIKMTVSTVVDWLKHNWQLVIWGILTGGIGLAIAWIVRHWDTVKHAFSATLDWVKHNWPLLLAIITGPIGLAVLYVTRHWTQIVKSATDAYHGVIHWIGQMLHDVGVFVSRLPGQIVQFFTALPGQLEGFFSGLWSSISNWFTSLPSRIGSLVSGAARFQFALVLAGQHLIEGLLKGASEFFTKTVPDFFTKTVWHGIVDFFKAVFGIHSPSTVMAGLGVNLMQGLLIGILNIATGIARFLDTYVVQPIRGFFTQTIPAAAGWLKDKVVQAWNLLGTGVKAVWDFIYKWVIAGNIQFFTVTIPGAASWLKDRVVGAWNLLGAGVKAVWDFIYKWVIAGNIRFFTVTIPNAAGWLKDKVIGAWNLLGAGVKMAWDFIYKWVIAGNIRFFTQTIPNAARWLKDKVISFWGGLRDGISGVYGWIRDHVFHPIGNFFTSTIPGWARTMKDKVKQFFSDMRDGIGIIWDKIKDKAKTPINWVIDHVWNRGIVSVWGKIAGWIGMKNSLGQIKLLAQGGTVGNEPFGVFNRPTAIVGEGNPSHPEFVIPTDPKYRSRALSLWQAAGAHFYESGGILGSIGGAISSAFSGAVSLGKSAMDFFTDPTGIAKKLLGGALDGLDSLGSSAWVKAIARLPHMAVDGLLGAVKKVGSSLLGLGGSGGGGAGVERWRSVVLQALRMVGQVPALADITLRRMNQESGGNPTIVNKWDSNWQRGTPSVGLMQVIGPTFRSYAGPFRDTGPFLYGVSVNPLANIYASMKYALGAYGSLASAYGRPGGYALGTMGATSGWHWLGEDGPELAKLPAGTRIRSNRASARQAVAAAPGVVHLTVENHGVIGSRHEVENWLVETLDQLRRQNRLPKVLGGTA